MDTRVLMVVGRDGKAIVNFVQRGAKTNKRRKGVGGEIGSRSTEKEMGRSNGRNT